MATLVLTVVGGVIGGPIGAAIGGLIGNAADRAIFKPGRREGPRLTDLAIQTSSYGTPIPKVFGTMRVAGSVIWATDLIESRSTSGGGKGQPSTAAYSYSASFAVALSGRPVLGVGRIWADGKLLRGAAGDWKTQTGFRLHSGGEDQPVDPLIAAHEGAGLAPAHRGVAYAVFEELQLADFCNRIPSLTFELTGDVGPVPIEAIASAVSGGVIGEGDAAGTLDGFSAYGDSARAVIELLGAAAGAWFAPHGDGIVLRAGTGETAEIGDAGFGREGKRRARAIRPIETVPRDLSVSHYDPARDYQIGVQQARRPGAGWRSERVEMPAAIDAIAARTMAEAMLARAEVGRVRRTVSLDCAAIGVAPGERVTIAGESGLWRVVSVSIEAMAVAIELVPLTTGTIPVVASAGRVISAPDTVIGETIVAAFEIPALDGSAPGQPRLTIAATGTSAGWRRAALLYSIDDGVSWVPGGATAAPATIGTVAVIPVDAPATLIDRVSAIEVVLAHDAMTLESATDEMMDRGANLALIGDELIQFAAAEPIGPCRWRLSGLLRGRRGTLASHAADERFALIASDAIVSIALPEGIVGRSVRVLASGVGDDTGPADATATIRGVSIAPPAPVHLTATETGDGGARVRWIRRSRTGWTWSDGVDAPLGEEREEYRVRITPVAAPTRVVTVTVPEIVLSATERAGGVRVAVRQLGTHGASADAVIEMA